MSLIKRVVRKEILGLERIHDTFDDRFDYLRLDKNERLLPFSKEMLDNFRTKIHSEDLSGYAELGKIYRSLSDYLGVRQEQLLLASGSDLAIKSVFESCIASADEIILHAPCYGMYKVYGKMFGAQVKSVPIRGDWTADFNQMLSLVTDKTKFVAIENPNGFVGTILDMSELEFCAAELNKKKVILLIDEAYCYIENDKSQAVNLTSKYANLIISQTFSKGHGLAGARFGYLIGDAELIGFISRVRPMHEITSLTRLCVEWALEHPELLKEYQGSIRSSKKYLKDELKAIGINYKDTHTNFMLLYLPNEGKTKDIAQKFKEKKILIRRPFEEPYLRGWSRVCVGSLEDSKLFINALKELLKS